jgi:hypothetical protein
MEKMRARTIDILLEDDDEWAKESVFKGLQCRGRTGYDKSDSSDSAEFIDEGPVIAPHQTRNALENVLIEVRIAGVFRNDTQDRHQTVENVFVSRCQGLPSSDNNSHNAFEKHQHCKQIIELNEKNEHFIK